MSNKTVLLDLEFTGLDGEYITDNEIIQFKALVVETGKSLLRNFSSEIPLSAHVQLAHGISRYKRKRRFNKAVYDRLLHRIGANSEDVYLGWGVGQDKKMLKKYGIECQIQDLQDRYRLSEEYEIRMAREGAGLEEVYFMVFGKAPEISHADLSELDAIKALYDQSVNLTGRSQLTVMPFGFCRGMPITEYVVQYRRQADGYRFNNTDLLAASLTAAIPERDWDSEDYDDRNWDDDDEDSDDEDWDSDDD
jgi:hypothetical protein